MASGSSVARLQQAVALAVVGAAIGWLFAWWPGHPRLAIAGAVAIVCLHSWVLALEFILLVAVRGSDPAPKASASQLIAAWWRETLQGFRVFAWRQPFRWRRVPDVLQGQARRSGIVFVHGFVCNRGFWAPWMEAAHRRGHPCIAVNLEPAFGAIDGYVAIIDDAVARMQQATGRRPVLVCHSMGGLAARAWLRHAGAADRIAHVVTIGTPHRGTWMARNSRLANGKQMRIGGAWLRDLEASSPPAAGRFTCWYGNADNIVFPPSTATLPGADNRLVHGAAHVDLAFQPAVVDGTFELLRAL
jgi:triacylglycerol lipase